MAKFNRSTHGGTVTSFIRSTLNKVSHTFEGAAGHGRDARSELFLLAVANMVGENTFYEAAEGRDNRYVQLVRQLAVADPAWTLGFVGWLRNDANMRSAALVAAAEAVHARLAAGRDAAAGQGTDQRAAVGAPEAVRNRQFVDVVLQRADEPGEMLAYWMSHHGRALPKPVKRGVADALLRLYQERSLLKYDTASKRFRFGDVVDLVHPVADAPWRGDLFAHALDRRHNRPNPIPDSLAVLHANATLRAAAADDPAVLLDPQRLREAGMTWEDALSLAGTRVNKARLWEAMIPSMGLMALARNLRNFDQAGVSDEVAATVAARFADPAEVSRSRMFPFRWLAAYRNAPSLRWAHALDQALTASLANVPALPGRTLVLVDVSGSMDWGMSARSDLKHADAAGVFGAAVALRAERATLVWFNHTSGKVTIPKGGSLLRLVEAIPKADGGTDTAGAISRWYDRHDRVLVVTDEQATAHGGRDVTAAVPERVPVYTWNLAGYRHGHAPSGAGNRHTFGGLTDTAFRMVPLLEAGRSATWPWQQR